MVFPLLLMILPLLQSSIFAGGLVSAIITLVLIVLVIFIVFKLGGALLHIIFGLIMNTILGLIAIFILNTYFALGIVMSLLLWILVAITGLIGVLALVILRLLGVAV